MSDIHLTENGYQIWDTDTMRHFNQAIDKIRSIDSVDAIIITGDLSNDGSIWTYNYIDQSFSSLGIPTICCPGNHDDIDMLLNQFVPTFIQTDDKVSLQGWSVYNLNSAMPEMSRGFISDPTLQWLESQLSEDKQPAIICFHHPSVEPGGWLSRKLLENREQFNSVICRYPNVKLVLYGHIHYAIKHTINGIIFSSAPSVGFAFDKDYPKYQIVDGQEGFNLIEFSEDEISINKIFLK